MKSRFILFPLMLIPCILFAEEISLKCTADLAIRQHKASFSNDFVESNSGKAKVLPFHGIHYIGGPQEVGSILLLNFDISSLKSKIPGKATLYLRGKNDVSKMTVVSVSTVATPWIEGDGVGDSPRENGLGASGHWASYKQHRWIESDPQSELIDVSFGLGNSYWEFIKVRHLDDGWIAIDIPQKVISALSVGASYGIALWEEKGQTQIEYQIFSRESAGSEPYILVNESTIEENEALKSLTNVKADVAPDLATLQTGAIEIEFDAPKGNAVAYQVSAISQGLMSPVSRYIIPFPQSAGTRQKIEFTGATPEQVYDFSISVVDGAGNLSAPAKVSAKSSPAIATPSPLTILKKEIPTGGPITVGGDIKIWGYDGYSKAHPVSGNLLEETGTEKYSGEPSGNYRNGNYIWNGKVQQVEISGCRNEFVSFNLCIEAANGLTKGQISLEEFHNRDNDQKMSLQFSNIYRNWYVKDGDWMPEIALPLNGTFSIPAEDNKISGQKNQSFLVEVYIPHDATPGEHAGSVTLKVKGIADKKIPVKLTVWDFELPDTLSFDVELNAYAWEACEKEYFRVAHFHRATLNVLPYNQIGEVKPGAAPVIEGAGAQLKAVDWQAYDSRYTSLFNGTAFDDLPRKGVPLPIQYLPMHENWPAGFIENLKYNPQETDYQKWVTEIALHAPPIENTFTKDYTDAFIQITRQFTSHFKDKGWNEIEMQYYLNNKSAFTKGKMGWWVLDEPMHTDDFLALRFYGLLFKSGLEESDKSQFVYRGDISRPQFMRNLLDDVFDCMYVSSSFFNKNNLCQKMMYRGIRFIQYGTSNRIRTTNLTAVLWPVRSYIYGADGVLPWNSFGKEDSFTQPRSTALLISGKPLGLDTIVASLRLKAMRRGQQDIEYFKLLEEKKGYNRLQIRKLVLDVLNLESKVETKDGVDFEDAGTITFDNVNSQQLDKLRRAIAEELLK
jgi:hypothetical protein